MRKKLTDDIVRDLEKRSATYSVHDTEQPRLELRVHPTGRRSFAARFSVRGKDVRHRLGRYPQTSLAQARQQTKLLAAKYERQGDFRQAEREAAEAEAQRRAFTVGHLIDAWLKAKAKRLRPSTLAEYRHRLDKHVRPLFGDFALDAVSRDDVRALVEEIGDRGHMRTANVVKQ